MPTKARFIPPMLLLKTDSLPDDAARWEYQLKLDGYRAIAFKTGGNVYLRSRNDKDFVVRYPAVVTGLARLPDETVIDGEVVAFPSTRSRTTVPHQGRSCSTCLTSWCWRART